VITPQQDQQITAPAVEPLRIGVMPQHEREPTHAFPMATIRPVHKSPSPTVAENWLFAVVSMVAPTVISSFCLQKSDFVRVF